VNGVDRGVKKITAFADGMVELNPNIGKQFQRRLEIRQRRLSCKKKSSNWHSLRIKTEQQANKLEKWVEASRYDLYQGL
jgi:transposase